MLETIPAPDCRCRARNRPALGEGTKHFARETDDLDRGVGGLARKPCGDVGQDGKRTIIGGRDTEYAIRDGRIEFRLEEKRLDTAEQAGQRLEHGFGAQCRHHSARALHHQAVAEQMSKFCQRPADRRLAAADGSAVLVTLLVASSVCSTTSKLRSTLATSADA